MRLSFFYSIPSYLPLSLASLGTSPSSLPVSRGGRRGSKGEVGGDGPK